MTASIEAESLVKRRYVSATTTSMSLKEDELTLQSWQGVVSRMEVPIVTGFALSSISLPLELRW